MRRLDVEVDEGIAASERVDLKAGRNGYFEARQPILCSLPAGLSSPETVTPTAVGPRAVSSNVRGQGR